MSKKETIIAFVILGIYTLVIAVGSIFYLSYTSPNESFASLRKFKQSEAKTEAEVKNSENKTTTNQEAAASLTLEQLKNGNYSTAGKSFKMSEGSYKTGIYTYSLDDTKIAASANGEQAVIVKMTAGGTGVFRYLVVLGNKGGNAQYIADKELGDRVQIETIAFAGDVITLGMITHGPEDPSCCPTQKTTKKFKLTSDSKLLEI